MINPEISPPPKKKYNSSPPSPPQVTNRQQVYCLENSGMGGGYTYCPQDDIIKYLYFTIVLGNRRKITLLSKYLCWDENGFQLSFRFIFQFLLFNFHQFHIGGPRYRILLRNKVYSKLFWFFRSLWPLQLILWCDGSVQDNSVDSL